MLRQFQQNLYLPKLSKANHIAGILEKVPENAGIVDIFLILANTPFTITTIKL